MRLLGFLLAAVGLVLGVNGCAFRATTDFGPGDEPHHQSVGAGAGPFPDAFSSDGHHGPAAPAGNPVDSEGNAGGSR